MKAIILSRVSTTEQEYGKSLEAQLSLGREYAQRQGLQVVKEYKIIESSTIGPRKEFKKMLAFVTEYPEPIAIIAHTVDRLQRRFDETINLLPLIDKGQIALHFISTGLVVDKDSPGSAFMMWDYNVVGSRAYILQLKENTKRGINKKIEDGEWPGKAPLGYLNYVEGKYHKIKIDEERAPFVQKAFEMYATGLYSAEEIWRQLRKMGLKSIKGFPIDRNVVHKMLQNPFYYGEMKIKGVLKPHIYPTLIDRNMFEHCQEIRRGLKKTPFKYSAKEFVFKGLLKCGCCGNRITSYTKTKPSGKQYTYLRCSKFSHEKTCTAHQIQEKVALAEVEKALNNINITPEQAKKIAFYLTGVNKEAAGSQIQAVKNANRELALIEQKINKLVDLQLSNTLPEDIFKQKLVELQKEQARLSVIKDTNTINETEFEVSVTEVLDLAHHIVDLFKSSPIHVKREIISCVLADLQIKGKNLYFLYKKPFDLLVKGSNHLKWLALKDSNLQPTG